MNVSAIRDGFRSRRRLLLMSAAAAFAILLTVLAAEVSAVKYSSVRTLSEAGSERHQPAGGGGRCRPGDGRVESIRRLGVSDTGGSTGRRRHARNDPDALGGWRISRAARYRNRQVREGDGRLVPVRRCGLSDPGGPTGRRRHAFNDPHPFRSRTGGEQSAGCCGRLRAGDHRVVPQRRIRQSCPDGPPRAERAARPGSDTFAGRTARF